HRFAADVVRPSAHDCEENKAIPDDLLAKFWELGLIANCIPEEWNGYGNERSALTGALIAEELAYGDLALALAMLSPTLFAYPVLEMGTREQQEKYLPQFCGDSFKFATAALTESRITFDPTDLKTVAEREGDEYVLNGEKCLVPFADRSDLFLIYASSAFGAGVTGIEGYIVEKGTAGLSIGEREKYMGMNALELHKVSLSNCRIPITNRLGGEKGCNFQRLLNLSRISSAAMATGICNASTDYAANYAKERVQFGEPIASRQTIAFMLADMATETDAMRFLSWKAACLSDKNEDCTRDAYLAKLYAGKYTATITDAGVQILGGHGYIREHPVELWFRNGVGIEPLDGLTIV
ncbi:MAG: acyl-CoA dehydrogenase, partial [Proteobacteria bacterium]|nr:acyl-CoA dehydrogenase [Pseudomonadota bacterium]